MKKRKFSDSGYAVRVLLLIAEIGLMKRSELSQAIANDSETSGLGSIGLTRGVKRLRDHKLIDTVKFNGSNYLFVTQDGRDYIQKYYPNKGYKMSDWSPGNKAHLHIVAKRSIGLYLYHTIGIETLPSEKPSFAEFCNRLANKHIFNDFEDTAGYNQNADVFELFRYGVYYDIQEVRDTFLVNKNIKVASSKTTVRGILINAEEVIFVYQMAENRTVIFAQVENEFSTLICKAINKIYEVQNGSPEYLKICNIIVADLRYLPTIVTGRRDGIQNSLEKSEVYTMNKLSTMCVKRLMFFDKIQIVPQVFQYLDYRRDQYDYNTDDYNSDLNRIIKFFPRSFERIVGPKKTTLALRETGEDFIICRYPDAKELFLYRSRYIEKKKKVSVVGIDDPKVADYISRSLQESLNKYYSIDTMEEITVAHYNEKGFREDANGPKAVYIENLF